MPLLDAAHVAELIATARLHRACSECGQPTGMDYCRTCDEFYWIHAPGCAMFEDGHFGHRLTIVPFTVIEQPRGKII